jgi:DNA primase
MEVDGCPRCNESPLELQSRGELFYCTRCQWAGGPLQYLIASGASTLEAAATLGICLIPPRRVLRTLRLAGAVYERTLWSESPVAQAFLHSRGIEQKVASRFHLGATPSAGTLIGRLHHHGLAICDLEAAGLLCRRADRCTDVLRSRLVFPLSSHTGRILGFAGRTLVAGSPKYMNTKVSAAGSGRDTLFGLTQAMRSILHHRVAWLVEGYIDVLACHQVGLTWVVAAGGTQPTILQALHLRRLTNRVVLILDGGTSPEVILRAAAPLHRVGLDVSATLLPPAIDPDLLVLREGADRLEHLVARGRHLGPQ